VSNTESERSISLSGAEREFATRLAENPMDLFQGKSIGWLEDFIRITVGGGSGGASDGSGSNGVSAAYYVPGDLKVVINDLTAEPDEYVYEDDSGQWLYCNGAAVSQTTYADLYAAVGVNAFGTDSGGNFFLPDPRGRALFFTGTNTAADLGDNDGVAEASRTAKHSHTNGVTASIGSLAATAGTLATSAHSITDLGHSHSITAIQGVNPSPTTGATGFTGGDRSDVAIGGTNSNTTGISIAAHTISGTPALSGSPAVGGTIGTRTPVDTPAHLFIGSLLVRF
jgi:microcystin-dependent protein